MFRPKIVLALAAALALGFGARNASADTQVYDLTAGNVSGTAGLSVYTGPYAEITVDRTDSTHATITADSLINGGYAYLFHNFGVGVHVNATTYTLSDFSATNSYAGTFGFDASTSASAGGTKQMDGFGNFDTVAIGGDSFKGAATEVVFTITNTSGTWASASNVLDSTNPLAAAMAAWDQVTSGKFNANTGFAGDASVVPEPSSLAIAGLGALGFIGFGLRRRLKK